MTMTELAGFDIPEVDTLEEYEVPEEKEVFDTESYIAGQFDCLIERYDY